MITKLKGGYFKLKNKKGAIGVVGYILIALLILGGGTALYFTVLQDMGGDDDTDQSKCADASGILYVNDVSLIAGGTAPTTPTITAGYGDNTITTSVTSGTTTFPIGAEVHVLISDDDSIDRSFSFVMPCGGYTLDGALYYSTSDNPGIVVWNDDNDKVSNDILGGTTNQTDLSAGETFSVDIEFAGTSTEASGDGILVIEFAAGASSNITKIELSGAESVSLPKVHSTMVAGGNAVAFKIPNVIGSKKSVHTLTVELTTSKDLMGGVYMDWYSIQEFIDDDYSLSVGVEDSDGTAKYENTLDFDWFINAA